MTWIKKYIVWLALLITLVVTFWAAQQDEAGVDEDGSKIVVVASNKPKKSAVASGLTQMHLQKADGLKRPTISEQPHNLFTPFTVAIDTTANTLNQVPAVVNPFTYAGKLIEDGKVVVFLLDGDNSHAVKTGDVIEETWQVISIKLPVIKLRNIPSKTEIQMQIGA